MLLNMYTWTKAFEGRRGELNEILQPHLHKLLIVRNNPKNNRRLQELDVSKRGRDDLQRCTGIPLKFR